MVFGIAVAVALAVIIYVSMLEDHWGAVAIAIMVVVVVVSVVNLILGLMWCSNRSWGEGRQFVLYGPCGLCCDERDESEDDTLAEDEQPRP